MKKCLTSVNRIYYSLAYVSYIKLHTFHFIYAFCMCAHSYMYYTLRVWLTLCILLLMLSESGFHPSKMTSIFLYFIVDFTTRNTLVNVYVDLVVFTRIAGTS